ncbi:MAG TPA: glycosyltransferase family 4 protein, partial [Burkholderiaceae bacterium]
MSPDASAIRVLIVAEHASARFGGEAALALHYFRVLRQRGIQVWLVTHARTRPELSNLFPDEMRIHYAEDTWLHRLLWRIGSRLPDQISYFTTGFVARLSTQFAQRRIIRKLVETEGIDVIHQPMPVSPREPSTIFGLGAPVVIGPMNGGMDYPPHFRKRRGYAERHLLGLGRWFSQLMNRLLPGKRHAACLLVANERTEEALPKGLCPRVIRLVENGVDLGLWRSADAATGSLRSDDGGAVVTFVFLGRLVGWKAVELLILAFAKARGRAPMRLRVIGDGTERARLEQVAREFNVLATGEADVGTVQFAGWMAQSDCARALQEADCLVLPSLLECGGAVVLEAMSMGKP